MGMVGQIYVRPRQNRVPVGTSLYAALQAQAERSAHRVQSGVRHPVQQSAAGRSIPPAHQRRRTPAPAKPAMYAYNDGDGSTATTSSIRSRSTASTPNFHFVGMTFNPEGFADMKDKYFLLNGRSYPDTVDTRPACRRSRRTARRTSRSRCPRSSTFRPAGKALLRISDLDVTEYSDAGLARHPDARDRLQRQAAARPGRQQHVLQHQLDHAGRRRVARRDSGCQRHDASTRRGSVFYLYTPNLDHLSNDAENFGGLMTEVHIN